ncbi:MAG: ABC transporter ATP-binding protein [Syntrophomonas sp.]|nr:ABC transporter ATP-binding protein [Syntrophomonas sp.]
MEFAVISRDLTRVFGNFTAVDGLTMSIRTGEVCGFLGPNGAGKSTAIRMLCGILAPSSGNATILGYDLLRDSDTIKKNLGYMSQKFSLYEDLSVIENLNFYAGIYSVPRRQRSARIAEMLNLADIAERKDSVAATLSVGWKQRLALGCAVISRPSLLFLDEPTSGVSPTSRRQFFNIIQNLSNLGTTVIVTTHFMDEAERCDRIAFLSNGKLMAFDSPDNLKKDIIHGQMVELELLSPMDQLEHLKTQPFVQECSMHGSFLHILLKEPGDISALQDLTGVQPRPIKPTLEDVFVALARKEDEVI